MKSHKHHKRRHEVIHLSPPQSPSADQKRSKVVEETPSKAEADEAASTERKTESPESPCSICLGKLENKSFTDSCFHTFCFVCLSEWSKVKAQCPLCMQPFKSIIHNVRSNEDYDQYHVPLSESLENGSEYRNSGRFRYRTTRPSQWEVDPRRREREREMDLLERPSRRMAALNWRRYRQNATSSFRKQVYATGMRVKELRKSRGQSVRYRDISARFYQRNVACTHRLVPWLNRELNVLMSNNEEHVHFVLELIMDLIKRFDINTEEFFQHIQPFLGRRTEHFIHEFQNFARSPYDMMSYDRHAVYDESTRALDVNIHTIEDSDNSPAADEDDDDSLTDTQLQALTMGQTSSYFTQPFPPSTSSLWPMVSTLSPLFRRVDNLIASGEETVTADSGWQSPMPGTSSSVWRSSIERPNLVISSSTSLAQPQHVYFDNADNRAHSPSSVASDDSDIVFVRSEKPWKDRSPITILSSEDEEIEVVSRSHHEHRRKRSKTPPVFYIRDDRSSSSDSRYTRHSKSGSRSKHRRRSRSREYHRHSHKDREGHRIHSKEHNYTDRHSSSRSDKYSSHSKHRHFSSDCEFVSESYHSQKHQPSSSSSNDYNVRTCDCQERCHHHHESKRSHSKHKKHKKHKRKKHKRSRSPQEAHEEDIQSSSKRSGYVASKVEVVNFDICDDNLSDTSAKQTVLCKKHPTGHKKSKHGDSYSQEKSCSGD